MSALNAPRRDRFDTALYALWWVLLLWGIFAENWWLFVPAAFMILLDKLDEL